MAFHSVPRPSVASHGLPWPSTAFGGLPWPSIAIRHARVSSRRAAGWCGSTRLTAAQLPAANPRVRSQSIIAMPHHTPDRSKPRAARALLWATDACRDYDRPHLSLSLSLSLLSLCLVASPRHHHLSLSLSLSLHFGCGLATTHLSHTVVTRLSPSLSPPLLLLPSPILLTLLPPPLTATPPPPSLPLTATPPLHLHLQGTCPRWRPRVWSSSAAIPPGSVWRCSS